MKKLLILLTLFSSAFTFLAQPKADIIVSYRVVCHDWQTDSLASPETMTLLVGQAGSKYFNDISLWNDSLSSTPQGKKQLTQVMMATCVTTGPDGSISVDMRKGPMKRIHTYVFNDFASGNITVYGKFGDLEATYSEPCDEMQWHITDSIATVLDCYCVLAETDYHGRRWRAWFSPEIPVGAGPWKFHGLPGLILRAETGDGRFLFEAVGMEQTQRVMSPIYSPEKYTTVDRRRALADNEHYLNNRYDIMKARFGSTVTISPDAKQDVKFDRQRYAIECDY